VAIVKIDPRKRSSGALISTFSIPGVQPLSESPDVFGPRALARRPQILLDRGLPRACLACVLSGSRFEQRRGLLPDPWRAHVHHGHEQRKDRSIFTAHCRVPFRAEATDKRRGGILDPTEILFRKVPRQPCQFLREICVTRKVVVMVDHGGALGTGLPGASCCLVQFPQLAASRGRVSKPVE
jgi:hypothetical protein